MVSCRRLTTSMAALAAITLVTLFTSGALAQETAAAVPDAAAAAAAAPAEPAAAAPAMAALADVDILWICVAAFLVFFMQAGFAAVETGFTRAKNACNIMMKNLLDFCIGSLVFWLVGFGLMFGTTTGWIGTSGFAFDASSPDAIVPGNYGWAFLIFQTVFAATAATIVSGAMAERTKFSAYLVYSFLITLIVYPIFGCWAWGALVKSTGSGWLSGVGANGFLDFAGSTVVHSIGGWAALAGAISVGPRIGKYKDGKPQPIPGHNIPLAAIGVFILWLGWFGFNPGSTTAITGGNFAYIAVTTNLAGATGCLTGLFTSWILFKKPDVSFALNGALAGLVAITAGCDVMSPATAVLTGGIGGILVVFAVLFFDRIGIDDPVGAISVHGVCGAFGTLAIGLFSPKHGVLFGNGVGQLGAQALGVAVAFAWSFTVSMIIFQTIKYTIGLRVSPEEEIEGLDMGEHGMLAYPPVFVNSSTGPADIGPTSGHVAATRTSSPVPAGV